MIQQWVNGKTILFLIAIIIATATIIYSRYLSEKIATDEKHKIDIWVEAQRTLRDATDQMDIELASKISRENKEIPIIETDENDYINPLNSVNLDSLKIKNDSTYLLQKLKEFKKLHPPILLVLSDSPYRANKYYYGESRLQAEVRYYPIVQLIIVGLFILITVIAQRATYRSRQNQLWVGMAKETAHQLGTPVSSLKGWVEVLKDIPETQNLSSEIDKDVTRLELVSDRFGKIGSTPKLEEKDVACQVLAMVDYIRKRAGSKVSINMHYESGKPYKAFISAPLFDWVIENLLKNGLDAMEGKGAIDISISDWEKKVVIDLKDSGKGISKANVTKVFNPGFTTKKRGWGLGLALAKRIIDQYHKGRIYVLATEAGKGTTFRIELNKTL